MSATLLNVGIGILPEEPGEYDNGDSFEAFKHECAAGTLIINDDDECTLYIDGVRKGFYDEPLEAIQQIIDTASEKLEFDAEAIACLIQTLYNEDTDLDVQVYLEENLGKEALIIESLLVDKKYMNNIFCCKVKDTIDAEISMHEESCTANGEEIADPNDLESRAHEYFEMTVVAIDII